MRTSVYFLLFLGLTQTGCGIGGYWMNGDPFYKPDIKPYIAYWTKEGMTEDERQKDSVSCRSGGVTGGGIYAPDFDAARLPGETQGTAYNRLILDWQRCMLRAGYHYTNN